MRGGVLHHTSSVRPSRSLVARGGLARTFGGLASFLVVTFLCSGIYILADAMANPIAAQAAAVIAGAFIIALATILLFYLIKPEKKPRAAGLQHARDAISAAKRPLFGEASWMTAGEDPRRDLAYQRLYVDHSRIRPRSLV
jgi:hypothetical protein